MALKMRPATRNDVDRLVELYALCYPLIDQSIAERQDYFLNNPRCDLDDVYVVLDGKDLVASMIAYPFTQFQAGVEIFVAGIANVMVAPDRRREGIGGWMMKRALEIFADEDVPAAILYPFEHRFYRYLGWGYATEIHSHTISVRQLADYDEVLDENGFNIALAGEADLPKLMRFYDAQARRHNGLLSRKEAYWVQKLVAPPRYAVLAYDEGEIAGYLIFSYAPSCSDNLFRQQMEIHEWMTASIDARDILLSFLARQSDQVDRFRLTLPPDEPLHLWLDDPSSVEKKMLSRLYVLSGEIGLGLMFRLVNLKAAFEAGRRFNGVKGALTIEMDDEQLGDRRLTVEFDGSSATAEGTTVKSNRIVSGSVDMLSQLFCGFTDAYQAFEQGLLEFEGHGTLEFCQRAFASPTPRCYDFF